MTQPVKVVWRLIVFGKIEPFHKVLFVVCPCYGVCVDMFLHCICTCTLLHIRVHIQYMRIVLHIHTCISIQFLVNPGRCVICIHISIWICLCAYACAQGQSQMYNMHIHGQSHRILLAVSDIGRDTYISLRLFSRNRHLTCFCTKWHVNYVWIMCVCLSIGADSVMHFLWSMGRMQAPCQLSQLRTVRSRCFARGCHDSMMEPPTIIAGPVKL